MKKRKVLVGFSVNPEVNITYFGEQGGDKKPLKDLQVFASGSSANIVKALGNLDCPAKLAGLTCGGESLEYLIWREAIKKDKISFEKLAILDNSGIAFIHIDKDKKENDGLIGRHGEIIEELVKDARKKIAKIKKNYEIRVATGVKISHYPLVDELFSDCKGFLIPKEELIKDKKTFSRILTKTRALFVNEYEYDLAKKIGFDYKKIKDLGVELLVVTKNGRGGVWFLKGQEHCYRPLGGQRKASKYSSGAGDWFLAGFLAKMIEKDYNLADEDEVRSCIRFASFLAGEKIYYLGGSNGPSLSQVKKELFL